MKNRLHKVAMLFIAAALIIVAGCSASASPKESLEKATQKMTEVTSYESTMAFGIDELTVPDELLQGEGAGAQYAINLLKGAKVNVKAIYQKEPLRTDMEMDITAAGLSVKIPMILTDKKMYVKIPALPMLMLPEQYTDKFVEIDLEELSKQAETGAMMDTAAQQKLGQEVSGIILKHFDEKTYFSKLKKEDAALPEGVEADQVVRFQINEGNYQQAVETIVNQVLPELIDTLTKNEDFMKMIDSTNEDVTKLKADFEANKQETLDQLKANLKINDFSIVGAIKDGYLSQQTAKINVDFTDESGGIVKIGGSLTAEYHNINKAPKFLYEIPTDAVKMDELMSGMGLGL
ncbi:hypothetical protein [Paenibacillus sp. FSL H8-0537]|uniref:hypothetical protein n=1 Tax=Paenibacillus sp. FSL H8-0537 TaxID=2921399 RepID=UPI003101B323